MSSSLRSEETSLQFVLRVKAGPRELIRYSGLHRSIVTVYVSPEKYPFYLHKGRLCQQSSYFEKAFQGPFKEAESGSVWLEEDGVDEFKLFEQWLYSGRFSYSKTSDDPSLLLVKVFCFAEKRGIPTLQNATLDAIRDRATEQHVSLASLNPAYAKPHNFFWSAVPTTTASAIHYAYQHASERSPLRKLLKISSPST